MGYQELRKFFIRKDAVWVSCFIAITKDASGVQTSWIIECKKYNERKVGVEIVRGLWGVKQDLRVAMAMLATTSHFTKGAHEFKDSRYDLELKDYEDILDWINAYRPNPNGKLYIKDMKLVLPGSRARTDKVTLSNSLS